MPENTQAILDVLHEFWNTGKAELTGKLYSEEVERIDPNQPEPSRGPQQIAKYVAELHTGFPDFKLEIKQALAEGDQLATEWTCTGTHNGEFQGILATGKHVTIDGVTINRMKGGRIVEERVYFDRLALLQQLGIAPGGA